MSSEIKCAEVHEPSKDLHEKGTEINVVKAADEENEISNERKSVEVVEEKENGAEIEKIPSFKEESNILSDLKEHEKKALIELKVKIEEAIVENKLFNEKEEQSKEPEKSDLLKENGVETECSEGHLEEKSKQESVENGSLGQEDTKKGTEEKEKSKPEEEENTKFANECVEKGKIVVAGSEGDKEITQEDEEKENLEDIKPNKENEEPEGKLVESEGEGNEKTPGEERKKESEEEKVHPKVEETRLIHEKRTVEVDQDISLWGVPLLPSKGDIATDVVLLKFLRARDFRVNDAFEMLRKSLQWRKKVNIDSIVELDFGTELASAAYMDGVDREGHPICYNIYGVFENDEIYSKIFGTEEKLDRFSKWRIQLMEKGIKKLDLKPGGISSLLQINDLKNSPGPSKKELRVATKQAVGLLQDNYPEFVARNIFINVPFWYYAFNALFSPFLTQRTNSKFVFARPSRVTETLLKYIPAEQIPIQYGGLKRESGSEFSVEDDALEVIVKSGLTESIEIPAPKVGTTLTWELSVLGWEVNYTEEFVPFDEGSYTLVVQKRRKMSWQEGLVSNSFRNNEPGKLVLTIENGSFKKKRVLYRYKAKSIST